MGLRWHGLRGFDRARGRAEQRAGEVILDNARSRAPKLSGDLIDSGSADVGSRGVRVGFSAPYAVKQNFKKQRHPGGGDRLFLNKAVAESGPEIEQVIADELRRFL
jgi:hypothetical protein